MKLLLLISIYLLLLTGLSLTGRAQVQGERPFGRPGEEAIGQRVTSKEAAEAFNPIVDSLVAELELWRELRDSLVRCPPDRCRDARRPDIHLELEKLYARRQELVRKLKKVDE